MCMSHSIVVAGDVNEQRLLRYVQLAHEQCFIANSISSEIVIEARIELRDSAGRSPSSAAP